MTPLTGSAVRRRIGAALLSIDPPGRSVVFGVPKHDIHRSISMRLRTGSSSKKRHAYVSEQVAIVSSAALNLPGALLLEVKKQSQVDRSLHSTPFRNKH